MYAIITQFAAETHGAGAKPGLFEALGIDWKLLILQTIAFLVLVFLLRRFVYPTLIKSIDDRQDTIDRSLKEAQQSHEALEQAEAKIDKMLREARSEADAIVGRSQTEAASLVAEAEDRAKERADRIVDDARTQLDADVAKARQALKQDTAKLVAQATERLIHEKIDTSKDAKLINRALETQERA